MPCGWDEFWGRALLLEQARVRALRLGQALEAAAWKIANLVSCHLIKYPLEVAAWENAFEKVIEIFLNTTKYRSVS